MTLAITVVNFIAQYLRPSLPDATAWTDAVLGYWIDAALIDISRSFPDKNYASWVGVAGQSFYAYADSTTSADELTIIRILNCRYPFNLVTLTGPEMSRKSHFVDDFLGGDYYDPDNDAQILYIGKPTTAGPLIVCDAHCTWKTSAGSILNPQEHYELMRLFCIWQAAIHQLSDSSSSPVPDPSTINSNSLAAWRAERAYRAAYILLDQAKATSGITAGWSMDKWDPNS